MHAATDFYSGMLGLPAVPAVSGAHDLVCRSLSLVVRPSGICSRRVPSVCSLQGRFLAVDAEMRLCAALLPFYAFLRRMRCGVVWARVSIVKSHWTEDRWQSQSKVWMLQLTPGRHLILPAALTGFARICILQEKGLPPTPDDQKRKSK